MTRSMGLVRFSKVGLVLAVATFLGLVGANNILDYDSNFAFVAHVLSMDTTFAGNELRVWRAVTDPRVHHIAYAVIIACELCLAFLCFAGAARMASSLSNPAPTFRAAKGLAVFALATSLCFWFVAFLIIGGEWFMMWQSEVWNGQDSAFRFLGSTGIILIFVSLDELGGGEAAEEPG